MRETIRHTLFGLYLACCLLALIWPGAAWLAAGPRPFVLGVPLPLAWYVGWTLLTFFGCAAYEATRPRNGR